MTRRARPEDLAFRTDKHKRKPPKPEPAWRQTARDMVAAGKTDREIGAAVGLAHRTVERFIKMDRGPRVIFNPGNIMSDADFIEPHRTRVVRQVFDRGAVAAFIASGGGARARAKMIKRIAA